MRIISGKNRGRNLKTLEGMNTRPTADKVKEALFNILGNRVQDKKVLDLFAGSGAFGLECISRGALKCVFVDNSKEAINIIKQNILLCNSEDKSEIRNVDYKLAIEKFSSKNEKFDLIFLDPPYSKNIAVEALENIESILADSGIIIVETDQKDIVNERYGRLIMSDTRKYGRTIISFFVREG